MRKETGSYRIYSIPANTAAFFPEFAVEDLSSAELQLGSCVCNEGLDFGQNTLMMIYHHHHQSVLPKGRSFAANSAPRLKLYAKAGPSPKLRNQCCSLLGINRCGCFSHPTFFSASEQTLKDLKNPMGPILEVRKVICLSGPSGLHRNSPQELNISSIRVFDRITDPEITITLRPPHSGGS